MCHLQVDGILCLADILTDDSSVEAARAEAAAVVAQITSPHHTSTQHLASFLESMHDIVTALISEWTHLRQGARRKRGREPRDPLIKTMFQWVLCVIFRFRFSKIGT